MLSTLGMRQAYAESKDTIEKLTKKYKVCIGSTTDNEPLMKDLKRSHIHVDYIFTSQSMKVYKPQKSFYEKIISSLGVSSDEALFVGDSLVDDILGPQQVGIKTCLVNRKNIEIGDIKPNYIVTKLDDIIINNIL